MPEQAAEEGVGLRFETVQPKHADALAELFERNSIAGVSTNFDPFPLTAVQARAIALDRHKDAYYLALRGGSTIGMSMLRGFDEGYEIPSFGIFVDHKNQGRGIGRALTVWTIEQAHLRGCSAVRLSVYAKNNAARGLYASLGFEEQERQQVEGMDTSREKIIMRLDLGG